MAKRAPILSADYNPVGARLQKALAPAPEGDATPPQKLPLEVKSSEASPVRLAAEKVIVAPTLARVDATPLQQQTKHAAHDVIPDAPRNKETMTTALRCRCTEPERRKWHDFAKEVTGEHNQLSHILRAMFLILENSHDHLLRLLPEMKVLKVPAKQDSIGIALYEQKLSQILWDGIKGAGRPRA